MSEIYQIYCTHCTHGSSALERREGELARRMLGYSARAGSVEAAALRRYYRQLERYIYYYLPRDTPAEEKLLLTADTAPRRLVSVPAAGGLRLVGQVCYRPTDTEGRPGSYFAHVLFADQKDGDAAWPACECLRLWRARGWVEEDAPQIPFLLPTLSGIDELLEARRGAMDDRTLLSFLTAAANENFDDPAQVIPPRWRGQGPAQRQSLAAAVLDGVLEATTQRQSLLLIVEPELAALLFYAALRLLPPAVSNTLSFSTFEPNPERLCTTLAATVFADRDGDLRAEAYRGPQVIINTFRGRRSERVRPPGCYAGQMVARLVEHGFAAVDGLLARMSAAGARSADDLEALIAVDGATAAIWGGQADAPDPRGLKTPLQRSYLMEALAGEVQAAADVGARLRGVAGGPWHLPLLDLAAGSARPELRRAAEFLLSEIRPSQVDALLGLTAVAPQHKVTVLARYAVVQGRLPGGDSPLWADAARALAAGRISLLEQVVSRLEPPLVEKVFHAVPGQQADVFVLTLLTACRRKEASPEALSRIVVGLPEELLLRIAQRGGAAVFADYPSDERGLGVRLQQVLRSLPRRLPHFSARLDLVLAGQACLPSDRDVEQAAAWSQCRTALADIGRLDRPGGLTRPNLRLLENACQRMAVAVDAALGTGDSEDRLAAEKETLLRQLGPALSGVALLAGGPWYHSALWAKIRWFFADGQWPVMPLERMQRRWRAMAGHLIGGRRLPWQIMVLTLAALGLVGLGVLIGFLQTPRDEASHNAATLPDGQSPPPKVGGTQTAAASQTVAPPPGDASAEKTARGPTLKELAARADSPAPGGPSAAPAAVREPPSPAKAAPDAKSSPSPFAEKPAANKPAPAPAATTAGGPVDEIGGEFRLRTSPGHRSRDEWIAWLVPRLLDGNGLRISPRNVGDARLAARCTVIAVAEDGTVRTRVYDGGQEFSPIGIAFDTVQVSLRLEFVRSDQPMAGGGQSRVARSGTYLLTKPVEGLEYTVTFAISTEGWSRLQDLSRQPSPEPRSPSPEPRSPSPEPRSPSPEPRTPNP